ncbi:MAG TPA: HDIG domain-containing protein [Desulfuromonadaceae bacterium]
MDTEVLLRKYFCDDALAMILAHGRVVADLAIDIAKEQGIAGTELRFVEEAALLHDIGICKVQAAEIGLHGKHPYIMHGILGRKILESEGLPEHALVCERHIGVGLTVEDIEAQKLPLPFRIMQPVSTAEQIICFADLFFSKKPGYFEQRKSPGQVRAKLAAFGELKVKIFDEWLGRFGTAL